MGWHRWVRSCCLCCVQGEWKDKRCKCVLRQDKVAGGASWENVALRISTVDGEVREETTRNGWGGDLYLFRVKRASCSLGVVQVGASEEKQECPTNPFIGLQA
jgi:hypothetical protein